MSIHLADAAIDDSFRTGGIGAGTAGLVAAAGPTRVVQIAARLEASCTERSGDLYRTKRVVQIALGNLYRTA